ncbi:MAG: uroporphyrinogen-III C-methyltransferase [Gammaproteobacteria bacterium]
MNDTTDDRPDNGKSDPDTPAGGERARLAAVGADGIEPVPPDGSAGGEERGATANEPAPAPAGTSAGAILALLIAVAAAVGTAYVWYEQQTQKILQARIDEIDRNSARRVAEIEHILERIEALSAVDRDIDSGIGALTQRVERDFAELPARLETLENTVEKVPGISQKARSAWLRSEAEYFLRVANAQLNLAGNVGVSLRALDLADAQLRDLADPALTPVREAISDERTALRAVPQPDAEGIVLALGSLARSLDSLTLADSAPDRYQAADNGTTETGWKRAWRVIVDALNSVISVKREDRKITPLLTAVEESMLIRSLDVDLQIARLAVVRNEGSLYRESLDSARTRLRGYFDTDSADVAAALATVEELAQAELPEQLPDISTSLTLLLQTPGVTTQ